MKTNEKVSNYIKLCSEWAEKFLQMDKEELKKRLPELKEEDGYLKITHFGVPFGIRLDDGRIDCLDGKGEANATEMLNIYTLLGYVKENASFMDKWVPFADLRDARPFGPAYKIGVTDVFAATFSGHAKELREAFLKLNGTELPQGDVGYQINAFECEPMRFYFWDCDDEFEAQGNILFDYSATDFNHVGERCLHGRDGRKETGRTGGASASWEILRYAVSYHKIKKYQQTKTLE